MVKFTVIPKKVFGAWQFAKIGVLFNYVIQKFVGFLVRGKSKRIEFRPPLLRDRNRSFAMYPSLSL